MPLTPRQPYPQDHASHIPILIGIGGKFHIRRVLELGAGNYSTSLFLNRDVFPELVELVSVERDPEWANKAATSGDRRISLTPDEPIDRSKFDLIFIDSAHMSERVEALRQLASQSSFTGIVVIHDSENPTYSSEFNLFPKWFDIDAYEPSTAVLWQDHSRNEPIQTALADIQSTVERHMAFPPDDIQAWIIRFHRPYPRLSVSVAMVAYLRHLQLRNTLETYLTQTRLPDQIVMVEDGYDGGATESVCREYSHRLPIEYICRRNRPAVNFSNASIPRNIGIRKSTGDIIVIQNPEVRFTASTDFERIVAPTEEYSTVSTCAPCESLNEDGTHRMWYCNPEIASNINHFCQAFRHNHLLAIGGFDENFRGYGYEDNDFNYRLNRSGVWSVFARGVVTQHQWHYAPPNDETNVANEAFNIEYGKRAIRDIMSGKRTIEANVGKEWGREDS